MKLKSWHIALLGSFLQVAVVIYAIIHYKAGAADATMFLIVPLIGVLFTHMLYSDKSRKYGALFGAIPSAIFMVVLSGHAKHIVAYIPLVPALLVSGLFYFWKERGVRPVKTAPVVVERTNTDTNTDATDTDAGAGADLDADSDSPEDATEAQVRKELGIETETVRP